MRSQMRQQVEDYCRETTIHGLRFEEEKKKNQLCQEI